MSQQNVQTMRRAYEAFNRQDIPAVLEAFAPDIEWVEPGGGNAPSGSFRGADSVGQDVFAKVPDNFDEFSADPEDFRDEGDTVVVTGRFKGKAKSGADLDASFEHVYELRDGKVVRFENKVEPDAWASAWS